MAMNSDTLGAAISSVIIEGSPVPPTPAMEANITDFWQKVAKKWVGHIQDNAEVPAGITVTTSTGSGSTTGTGKVK
jgi:hypothetical protein